MIEDLKFKDVPRNWVLCYVSACPRKEECLRYQAYLLAPPMRYVNKCVLPNALRLDPCPMFRPIEKMKVAYGFSSIFDNVMAKDLHQMRDELQDFLGSRTTYHRYKTGERPLYPLHQQWIVELFRRYGYDKKIVFDKTKEIYVFD